MESLKVIIPDKEDRKKHILENMLYASELNKKNVLIYKQIFDLNNNYKLNIHEGNSLTANFYEIFGVDKFDIIVGNPPYQEVNASGDNKLYLDFTKMSINLLKSNMFLLFITPRSILDYLLLVDKNRIYIDHFYQLNFISIETINKYFPNIGSTFTYFILQKKSYDSITTIEYIFDNKIKTNMVLLEIGYKIPKILTPLDIEIISKITSNNNYVLNDFLFKDKTQRIRKEHINKNIVSNIETVTHDVKIIDTVNKSNPFPGKYYYYNKKDNAFNVNKLILSKKGYLTPYIDNSKSYTYSDNFKYIIDDNLDKVKLLLESRITKYLIYQFCKNGFDYINVVKMIDKKDLKNIKDENDLYLLFNLNQDHVNHINHLLKKI